MHTLHWVAVEADSIEEAEQEVLSQLLDREDNWWDWFDDSIGGRWADEAKTLQGKDILAGLERVKETRKAEIKSLLERTDLTMFEFYAENYDGEDLEGEDAMNLWRISAMAKVISGEWSCDSFFTDLLEYGTANTGYLLKRLESEPEKQFLVPIDFHY